MNAVENQFSLNRRASKKQFPISFPIGFAWLGLITAGWATAQTFTTLHSFNRTSDGANPVAGLVLSGNSLFGRTIYGGSSGCGTVFRVNTDGAAFTNVYSFSNSTSVAGAGVVLTGSSFYGTINLAGNLGFGTVFKINSDGTAFTNLYGFTGGSDGAFPQAGLIVSGSTLYGTADTGSPWSGTVFAIHTDGTGFTNLHKFIGTDGSRPAAALVLSGNTLYGSAQYGGSSDWGVLFAVNADGTGFTNLHHFAYSDGAYPRGALILSGNTLFGTTAKGGVSGNGTVFAVKTDGSGFKILRSFAAGSGSYPSITNSDGVDPEAGLILSGKTLYGTTKYGGSSGAGTVFAVNTNGTGFKVLHSFSATSPYPYRNSDGARPVASLMLSGNALYGTAYSGGSSGNGTVFSLTFPLPQLTIIPVGTNMVLTWLTNSAGFDYSGFTLQSAPDLYGSFTNLPGARSPYTNPITGGQQFFRLISN